ncbi:DUF4158 domain-containing protein [Streptomyces xanthophaeus]
MPCSPGELEQSFRRDTKALEAARSKRAPANRLGWSVRWGCVRMLGVFPTEDVSVVPEAVVRFAAQRLDVGPGERGRPDKDRICSRCPGCGDAPTGRPRTRGRRPDAPSPRQNSASLPGRAGPRRFPCGRRVVRPAPDDRTTARPHRTSRSGGARISGPR